MPNTGVIPVADILIGRQRDQVLPVQAVHFLPVILRFLNQPLLFLNFFRMVRADCIFLVFFTIIVQNLLLVIFPNLLKYLFCHQFQLPLCNVRGFAINALPCGHGLAFVRPSAFELAVAEIVCLVRLVSRSSPHTRTAGAEHPARPFVPIFTFAVQIRLGNTAI